MFMPDSSSPVFGAVADRLAELYDVEFGSKPRGRYRISKKYLQALTERRRLYPDDIQTLGRALYERGFVLIDLETFCAIVSLRTFNSYRRVNDRVLM